MSDGAVVTSGHGAAHGKKGLGNPVLGMLLFIVSEIMGMNRALAITVLLGVVFLIGQVYDYTQIGFGISDGVFGSTFYVLTGFHGAHVLGGVLMLAVCLYRGSLGQFSAEHHDMVEASSIYWHFVDVVWILLFALLYFI